MLVSEKVPFVKNGSYQKVEPFCVRVFSYSAPNNWRSGITPEVAGSTFARRAHQIVHRAAELGTEVLILGAWGCGEYANEPEMVAKAFKTAIGRLSGGIAIPAGENALQPLGQLFRARQVSDEYEGGRGGAIVAIVKLSQVGA